jgi:hypothetical protein
MKREFNSPRPYHTNNCIHTMNKRYSVKKRAFITDARHADSFIRYNVNYYPSANKKHWRTGKKELHPASFSAWIKLSDCGNSIDWDFGSTDAQKKLNTTRRLMTEFFDAVQRAINDTKQANKKGKNVRKRKA